MTLNQFAGFKMFMLDYYEAALKSAGLAASTRRMYYKKFSAFVEAVGEVNDMHQNDISAYIRDLRLNPAQQIITTAAIKFYYETCLGRFVKLIKTKRHETLPQVLTTDELKALFQAIKEPDIKLMIETMYYLGLRRSEAFKLSVNDLLDNAITIRKSKSFDRVVPVNSKLMIRLQDRATRVKAAGGRILFDFHEEEVRRIFKTALKSAGITKDATFHTLRHSCATNTYQATRNFEGVQNLLGHKNPNTTRIYVKFISSAVTPEVI